MLFKNSLLLLILLSFSYNLISQDISDTTILNLQIKEVTITATKKEKEISKVPLPVNLIKNEEIQRTNSVRLNEVITKQTGITTVSTRIGTEGIQIQGLDASYATILLDGYPLIGRSFGVLDLNRISLLDLERIEIVSGASSSLYGSDALAGVINLVSKTQQENGKILDANVKLASNNTINPSLSYKYKKGLFEFLTSGDYYKTEGYDLIDTDMLKTINPYENYCLQTKMKYTLSNKLNMNIFGRYYKQDQLNTAVKSAELFEGKSILREWNLGSSFKYFFTPKFTQEIDIYATNYKADEFLENTNGDLYDENYFDHILFQSESKTILSKKHYNIIFGFGMRQEKLERNDFNISPEEELKFAYAQLDGNFLKFIDLIAGTRYDDYSDYTSEFSNKIAIGITPLTDLKFNTSIGTGFKTPDFRQRYFDFTNSTIGYTVLGRDVAFDRLTAMQNDSALVNVLLPFSSLTSPLKPEESLNVNLGFKYTPSSQFNFDVNFFHNRVSNLIEAQLIGYKTNSLPIFSYFNINKIETKGFGFNLGWNYKNKFSSTLGYQLLYAFDKEVQDLFEQGKMYARDSETLVSFKLEKDDYVGLFNRSRHMSNLKVFYHHTSKLSANIITTYRSKYALNDSNGNLILDRYDEFISGYMLFDLNLSYKLSDNQNMRLGINNIFNTTNINITNIPGRIFHFSFSSRITHP